VSGTGLQEPNIRDTTTAYSFNASTGNLVVPGTVTASSDISLKTNINPIENALEKVLKLRGVEFNYKEQGTRSIGVIAQEIEEVFPELVYGDEVKSVAYQNLVAVLIEAIKELYDKYFLEFLNDRKYLNETII
jgi:hypothetical protein